MSLISGDVVYDTPKTLKEYAHILAVDPHSKMSSVFGTDRSAHVMRDLFRSEYLSEPFIEKHAISTEPSNVDREKHRRKSHRVCRRDREPDRIQIRSLNRLRNKSRKVRKFVYVRIFSCIPMSSTLYCLLMLKKLLNKRTFEFNCRERIRQLIFNIVFL